MAVVPPGAVQQPLEPQALLDAVGGSPAQASAPARAAGGGAWACSRKGVTNLTEGAAGSLAGRTNGAASAACG